MIVGVGVDLVDVRRIEAIWANRRERFSRRVLHATEIARGMDATGAARAFAVKEAAAKALGHGLFDWPLTDVRLREMSGRWSVELGGRARQVADARGASRWHVDVSVESGFAAAVVVAETD